MNKCEDVQRFLLKNSSSFNLSEIYFQYILDDICNRTLLENSTEPTKFSPQVTETVAVAMTTVYATLLLSGVTGNIVTCAVIARNRYMHTATNCYLFSLAVSDLLLLITGIPHEIHMLWIAQPPYTLGEAVCIFRGFTAETSAYASVLTIMFFTVERYVAICHPLKAHALSGPSRTIKCVVLVWIIAATSSLPIALQFGLIYKIHEDGTNILDSSVCALKRPVEHAFLISAVVFFCFPLMLIFVLYVRIGFKLRKSMVSREFKENRKESSVRSDNTKSNSNRKGIIKMLGK